MTRQEFAQILRSRWKIVCAGFIITVMGVVAYSMLATPRYAASTRLFVTTAGENDGTKINDGRVFAERRVVAYVDLLTGEVLAQRTIAHLKLNMAPAQLQEAVSATAPVGTVLIDVTVTDPSPARARDIVNTLSDEFALMAANLEMAPGGRRPNAQVVVLERANVPEHPVTPKKTRNLIIGSALGLLLGVILAVFRDRLDSTVKKSADAEDLTGVGVIGEIPFHRRLQKHDLITFAGNFAPIAEAFRELRTNLQRLEIGEGPRVVGVASSKSGEGRTVTAINLALALAAANNKVVVVDGNFRNPQVASFFGIDEQVGLCSLLIGEVALDEALKSTRFAGLTALTAGVADGHPPELIGADEISAIVNQLSRDFDYVIVDSPPAMVGDACVLAKVSQGVLLIARVGKTRRSELERTAAEFRQSGALVLGVVMTMTAASKWNSVEVSYYQGLTKSRRPRGRLSGLEAPLATHEVSDPGC